MTEFPMVEVLRLKVLPDFRLWLRFTDGREGIWDMSALLSQTGPMLEPLRDPDFFARAFVEMGAPTWPNGFDIDPIHLYLRMRDGGTLSVTEAA
jgi:Protein of unknown function (DUF2442)